VNYNVIDSSGWIEYFREGPNIAFFEPVLEDIASLVIPTITLVEVCRHMIRWRGTDEAEAALARMKKGVVVELTSSLAFSAGKLGIEYKLPLADSIVLATARAHGATLWTQDADFENVPDVRFVRKQ
jgi:predicted nucleic acid-binding protein